jgi:hypothetical protein
LDFCLDSHFRCLRREQLTLAIATQAARKHGQPLTKNIRLCNSLHHQKTVIFFARKNNVLDWLFSFVLKFHIFFSRKYILIFYRKPVLVKKSVAWRLKYFIRNRFSE